MIFKLYIRAKFYTLFTDTPSALENKMQ